MPLATRSTDAHAYVAAVSGCSDSTVRRYLAGRRVRSSTRARIEDALRRLDLARFIRPAS